MGPPWGRFHRDRARGLHRAVKPSLKETWKPCWEQSQGRDADLDTEGQELKTVSAECGLPALTQSLAWAECWVCKKRKEGEREGGDVLRRSTLCALPLLWGQSLRGATPPWQRLPGLCQQAGEAWPGIPAAPISGHGAAIGSHWGLCFSGLGLFGVCSREASAPPASTLRPTPWRHREACADYLGACAEAQDRGRSAGLQGRDQDSSWAASETSPAALSLSFSFWKTGTALQTSPPPRAGTSRGS